MSLYTRIKRSLLGKPLPTSAFAEERLSNAAGLAVLSSDALSSVAYATEEILLVLILAGSNALKLSLPIGGAILLLLTVVTLSYRQTIRAYPGGGGAYTVSRENLGLYPGLVAAAALAIDYVLTVTVSISAGVAALTSAIPFLSTFTIDLCLLAVFLVMLANLRGVRAAGNLLMLPTYGFIASIFLLVCLGLVQQLSGYVPSAVATIPATEPLSLFLILRAFAAGCTALTGIEAISNGVMAFKPPEWKNARLTMLYMSAILGVMFTGITYLVHAYHIVPTAGQTVVSLLGRHIFGNGLLYYVTQATTLLILLLAANTSFADFPRLASLLARDGFLPRQLSILGDRLIYSNGILLLSLFAAFLIILFQGQTNAIIPLYAVGVFTSFTLSQTGMVLHWFNHQTPGWKSRATINGIGATVTAIVLGVIVVTKFLLGAWLVVVMIPLVVWLFLAIRSYYQTISDRLSIVGLEPHRYPMLRTPCDTVTHPALVLVGQLHRGTLEALDYARSIADEIVAVHVDIGTTDRDSFQQQWQQLEADIPLAILDSPYRSVISPLSNFVSEFEAQHSGLFCTIVIPIFVTRHWWENLLHNQTAWFLKAALRVKRSRVVTFVGYYI
ncbi:APC family permease [Chroococcidiopsis thermalis]|uniref:Amino acid/polyamine/organocation transporter, APC superfamily n=1 Tax=Chroococcidiopsis thermalis (strain PCC 7203) TaxID=251229 RepID=K9UAP6_CHRTP|nr:APC family permease [Chroococcidiopsis thermalis]AFY91269.1 amino acid/polyamine/organocation transporter, APC superfamily [Chroococcidiopsis thermalis PCC 7203]